MYYIGGLCWISRFKVYILQLQVGQLPECSLEGNIGGKVSNLSKLALAGYVMIGECLKYYLQIKGSEIQ